MQPRQSTGEGYLQSTAKNRGGPVPSGSTRSSTMVPVVHGPIPTALLARGPRKPGVQAYSTSEPCTRVASNSVTTVTPGTGSSITSTMTVSAEASPCGGGGPGAFIGAFFVAARFAFVLVTRFLGAVLAATRLGVFVLAARLCALPRFSVAFRAAPRFFRRAMTAPLQ